MNDIQPLVDNPGIAGYFDFVNLMNNDLDENDCGKIKELTDRAVTVTHDIQCQE